MTRTQLPTVNSIKRTKRKSAPGRRLFFALWPDSEVQTQLSQLQREVCPRQGRAVPAENLHLTLLFLGSVEEEHFPTVRNVAADITGHPFELRLDRLGTFRQAGSFILWAGPSELPDELKALHHALHRTVARLGISVKERGYRPHVTLFRKAVHDKRPPLQLEQTITWQVNRYALYESQLTPEGARYTKVSELFHL